MCAVGSYHGKHPAGCIGTVVALSGIAELGILGSMTHMLTRIFIHTLHCRMEMQLCDSLLQSLGASLSQSLCAPLFCVPETFLNLNIWLRIGAFYLIFSMAIKGTNGFGRECNDYRKLGRVNFS